jgi:hypothetical protein
MHGGTSSNRDSRQLVELCRRACLGRNSSKGKAPLLRRQAGVASSWSVEQTPLVRLLAIARRCGNAKSRLPRSREEMLVQVSLCGRSEIADRKERSILKIFPPFSFEFSSFSGRQELAPTLKGSARSSNAPSTTILLYVKTFKFNLYTQHSISQLAVKDNQRVTYT